MDDQQWRSIDRWVSEIGRRNNRKKKEVVSTIPVSREWMQLKEGDVKAPQEQRLRHSM